MKSIQEESTTRSDRIKVQLKLVLYNYFQQLSSKVADLNGMCSELQVERDIFKSREAEARAEVQSLEERFNFDYSF